MIDLLIRWKDGTIKTVHGVTRYGYDGEVKLFWFIKNNWRSFITPDSISFFGREYDYCN